MMRLAAEFDNYKKQVSKEIANAQKEALVDFIRKLLDIVDTLELALTTLEKNKETTNGVGLVLSNLMDMLKNIGVHEIDTKGKYDPYKHEVVMTIECDNDDGLIIDTIKKGYMFNDILIRPAYVIVSKKKNA